MKLKLQVLLLLFVPDLKLICIFISVKTNNEVDEFFLRFSFIRQKLLWGLWVSNGKKAFRWTIAASPERSSRVFVHICCWLLHKSLLISLRRLNVHLHWQRLNLFSHSPGSAPGRKFSCLIISEMWPVHVCVKYVAVYTIPFVKQTTTGGSAHDGEKRLKAVKMLPREVLRADLLLFQLNNSLSSRANVYVTDPPRKKYFNALTQHSD